MRKRIMTLIVLGCLTFTSCKKDEISNPEIPKARMLKLNGQDYEVDFVRSGLSRLLAIPIEKLVYDEELSVFRYTDFTMILEPSEYIGDIETIKKEGYEF